MNSGLSKLSKMEVAACIFDLDGVLVDTAGYHYAAWRDIAQNWNIDLTLSENEKLKGVSRVDSLIHILQLGEVVLNNQELQHWCAIKNEKYLDLISDMDKSELLPNVEVLLEELGSQNIKIGLGSASKNASYIIEKTGIAHFFEAIVGGGDVVRSKPHPEVFLTGASLLSVEPERTIVFEDSQKGIEAAKLGGFMAVGIGSTDHLNNADIVIPGFESLKFEDIVNKLTEI